MKKRLGFLFTAAAALTLAACGSNLDAGGDDSANNNNDTSQASDTASSNNGGSSEVVDLETSAVLNIAHAQNNSQTLTYNQTSPITLPSGETVVQGDLKPVWQYVSDEIGIEIRDTALQDATPIEFMELQATTNFGDATIYSGDAGRLYMRYGQEGYFLDLKSRLDDMPNVKRYFEENPSILDTVTASDGGLYHLPYIPELGYHTMVFFGRPDWVISLLDTEDNLESETETIDIQYDGFFDSRHANNVVELQNEAANGGTLNRDVALTALKDYIAETYPELASPSDLYLGADAQYDIDELVALWRVIKLSPNTLSKVTTGEVVEGALTTPFFIRSTSHTNYPLRLVNYFGGQIAGITHEFYINEEGELSFSWNEPGALTAYTHMREIFAEGLIYSEMASENNDENFRNLLYSNDDNPDNTQFGFMTLDWIASTSTASDKIEAMLPPMTTFFDDEEFIHYIGGNRQLSGFGMAVSTASSETEINSALKLFDFIFSDHGYDVLNFGTPDMWAEGETFVGPDGTEYPKIGEWAFEQAENFSNNDLMSFMKYFLGANLQVAYEKSIGVELQYTNELGLDAWDLYQNNDVYQPGYDVDHNLLKATPAIWPVTEQRQARLDQTNIGNDQRDQIKLYIYSASAGPQTEQEILDLYEQGNVETYINVYREMYNSMEN